MQFYTKHFAITFAHSSLSLDVNNFRCYTLFLFCVFLRYCQKLPKDSFTVLSPNFTTKKRPIIEGMTEHNPYRIPNQNEEFKTTLTLPMSSLVKHPIEVRSHMTYFSVYKVLIDRFSSLFHLLFLYSYSFCCLSQVKCDRHGKLGNVLNNNNCLFLRCAKIHNL